MSTHNENSAALLNAATGTITASATAQSVFASAPRNYIYLQNVSDTDMYVGIGFTPTVGGGILLKASGGAFTADGEFVPAGEVKVICSAASKTFVALQG